MSHDGLPRGEDCGVSMALATRTAVDTRETTAFTERWRRKGHSREVKAKARRENEGYFQIFQDTVSSEEGKVRVEGGGRCRVKKTCILKLGGISPHHRSLFQVPRSRVLCQVVLQQLVLSPSKPPPPGSLPPRPASSGPPCIS